MTLRQFVMLAERHKDRVRREDRRSGEIVAMYYNMKRDTTKDPQGMDWEDVFPEWKEQHAAQTEDEMFEAMMMWTKRTEGLSH